MKVFFVTIALLFLWASVSYSQNMEFTRYQPVFIKDKREHHPEELERSMKLHGRWIEVPKIGYVWRPDKVPSRWNPIKEGHKVWSPAFGGYVLEYPERPWGWLPLEEGEWQLYSGTGWVWVPNQAHIFITPNGISFQIDIGSAPVTPAPQPPVVYYPEEEENYPGGHAYGHYKHKHKHEREDEDDD